MTKEEKIAKAKSFAERMETKRNAMLRLESKGKKKSKD